MNEKLKEIMASKVRSRNVSSASASVELDAGAFEDKLNEELAVTARDEWLKRLEVAGLDEQDWIDISPAEMEAVEAAFTPQRRPKQPQLPPPPPPAAAPAPAAPARPAAASKPTRPFAATVEDVPLPADAWKTPSKTPVPGKGIIGRTRPDAPILARVASPALVSTFLF